MIGSWFALQQSARAWGWEVVSADGSTVSSGVTTDEAAASWDCRIALFLARIAAGEEAIDVALVPAQARSGGRRTSRAVAA